jgi:hypothetical protein
VPAVVPAARVHVPLEGVKVPVLLVVKVMVPVGVVGLEDVSVTVPVQVEPWLTTTGVLQLTVVVVARRLTTMLAVPLLEL